MTPAKVELSELRKGKGSKAKIIRRTASVRLEHPLDAFTLDVQKEWIEGDAVRLAAHLAARLHTFVRSGKQLVGWQQSLLPVLRAYVDLLKTEEASQASHALAWTALRAARGEISAETAFAWARKARGESHWSTKDGATCTAERMNVVAARKRGPLGADPIKARARRIYQLIAWGSRADVLPTEPDGRPDRADRFSELFDQLHEVNRRITRHNERASNRRKKLRR